MSPYNYPYAAAGFTLYANALYNPSTSTIAPNSLASNSSDGGTYEQTVEASNNQFYPSAQQLIESHTPSDESNEPPQINYSSSLPLPKLNST